MIWFILGLGVVLRLINLDQSLWLDEATQVILSQDSLSNIFYNHGADFHPPLSYILMHFWIFLGTSESWLRLLSVIFGVLTIWFCYKLASGIFNPKIGLLSALLLAISPYHIYYSQEVRMYSEMTFFAVCSMYFFYRYIKENKLINSFVYIFATTALIYTHYDGVFLIAVQMMYILFFKRNLVSTFFKNIFLIFLLYLPWLPYFLIQLRSGLNIDQYLPGWREVLTVSTYKALPLIFFKFSFGRIDFENQLIYMSIAILVLLVFGFAFFIGIRSIKNLDSKLILFWFFVPIVLVILVSLKVPINQPFRILYVIPAYYILLALGISQTKRLTKLLAFLLIVLSLAGLSLYYLNPRYWREDWRSAVKFTEDNTSDNSLVIFAWPSSFPPYQWYSQKNNTEGIVPSFPAKYEDVRNKVAIHEDKNEIFFFQYLQALSDPDKNIQKSLTDLGFIHKDTYNFNGVGFVYRFTKDE